MLRSPFYTTVKTLNTQAFLCVASSGFCEQRLPEEAPLSDGVYLPFS